MTLVQLLMLLLVAAVAVFIVGGMVGYTTLREAREMRDSGIRVAGFTAGGCLVGIALGFVGALVGGWLADELGLPEPFVIDVGGQAFPLIWSIVGAALFVAILSLISGRRA